MTARLPRFATPEQLRQWANRKRDPPRVLAPSAYNSREEHEQMALLQWARLMVREYPALTMLAHIPNGGSRHVVEAVKLRKLGVLPGMPDLVLLYPARGKHGWLGEMKTPDGRLTEAQYTMLLRLRLSGYFADVFRGWEQARDSLVWYLAGPQEGGDAHDAG